MWRIMRQFFCFMAGVTSGTGECQASAWYGVECRVRKIGMFFWKGENIMVNVKVKWYKCLIRLVNNRLLFGLNMSMQLKLLYGTTWHGLGMYNHYNVQCLKWWLLGKTMILFCEHFFPDKSLEQVDGKTLVFLGQIQTGTGHDGAFRNIFYWGEWG